MSVTFVIPTIGRNTLEHSINSIINQTNDNWKIIVVFDGIKPNLPSHFSSHSNINIFEIKKTGQDVNSAGNVRNYGMAQVNTEYIAFLDDDDTIDIDYVEVFFQEIANYPNTDCLIFRMINKTRILPPLQETQDFHVNNVGISFVIKTQIFTEGNVFTPSDIEDYIFLNMLKNKNKIIMISPFVKYFVNGNVTGKNKIGQRVIIDAKYTTLKNKTFNNMTQLFTKKKM
jgi:glycosyltransferase involved in cell wall biosynthesis